MFGVRHRARSWIDMEMGRRFSSPARVARKSIATLVMDRDHAPSAFHGAAKKRGDESSFHLEKARRGLI
jgi:hypothetical protein